MSNPSVAQRLQSQLWQVIAATPPGERLPSEPYLAQQLGVSRATLREAMRAFETQGLIRRRQGSGTYVNQKPRVMKSGLEVLESIERMAQQEGISVNFGRLEIEQRTPTPDEQTPLELDEGRQVVSVSRTILVDNREAAYLIDILPVGLIEPSELSAGFHGSILDLLLQRDDLTLAVSRTEINAVPASSQVARALGIQRGDVLLRFVADLFTQDGKAIDHSTSYFIPGYFRFELVRRISLQTSNSKT